MSWQEKIEGSRQIVRKALIQTHHSHYATIVMLSGGDDSLTALNVARYIGFLKIDAILHVRTGTGIPETSEFVRKLGESSHERYFEFDAGTAYEDYVMRKGFFGRGMNAHAYAYHLLKADGFRKIISREFRQGKRGRDILLINGARQDESENRMFTMREPIQREQKGSRNWWVNIINDWTKAECRAFLNEQGIDRSPVTKNLCRSGECMCGTMQSQQERAEAAFFYPQWGQWLNDLEARVIKRHPWGWGENIPQWFTLEQAGQMRLFDFQPMCQSCTAHKEEK
jgi:3'-phosphoadenosine 5'-phosphosulfate sulfotransferase (PAPS reductase)/FAD synthetase